MTHSTPQPVSPYLEGLQPIREFMAAGDAPTPATREDGASGADGERLKGEIDAIIHRILPPANAEIYIDTKWRAQMQVDLADAILALRPLSPDQPSARERRLEEALERLEGAGSAVQSRLQQAPAVQTRDFHDVSIPFVNALNEARQALAHNQEGGR